MKNTELTYKPFGPATILIEWPAKIEEAILLDILSFEKQLAEKIKPLDTIIAYHSLTICYSEAIDFESEVSRLKELYPQRKKPESLGSTCWHVPVCYDGNFGLDLKELTKTTDLLVDEVVHLHTKPEYQVYFIGFQPGFMYLGGLDKRLHKPRREDPRLSVPKGSVGIGGAQTGIYPQDHPGGWNIIGRTPIDLFNSKKPEPCFAKAGDRIKFVSIDQATFHDIEMTENYELKLETI